MRKFIFTLACIVIGEASFAQTAGTYNVTGYFFHNTAPRAINVAKTLTSVSPGKFQADIGDLTGFSFQFDVDQNNNLINWTPVGSTPALPASNFMTLDNPANFVFPGTVQPGAAPWNHSTYQNRYDPATKTFYMHYGYQGGSLGQSGYLRQVYEQWKLPVPSEVTSASPLSGTSFTQVTITGDHFNSVNPSYGVTFGGVNADSVAIVSDNEIKAWVASGASGKIVVGNADGVDSLTGFVYTPATVTADINWRAVGNAGFSPGPGSSVNPAVDRNNIIYVAFIDSASGKPHVMKFFGGEWLPVGNNISSAKGSLTRLVIDTGNAPIIAFADSSLGGRIVVKKFNDSSWVDLAMPMAKRNISMAVDGANTLYLTAVDTSRVNVYKYQSGSWTVSWDVARTYYDEQAPIAIDKTNVPYFIHSDNLFQGNASVKKLSGGSWVNVGNAGFSNSLYGIFYGGISIDKNNNPVVVFQEDDGFERISVYKFSAGTWSAFGYAKFSKGRSHFASMTLDTLDQPAVAFLDFSINKLGTIRKFAGNGLWDTLGSRAFLPAKSLEKNALFTDRNNTSLIAFADLTQNGKVTVRRYVKDVTWVGGVGASWENASNWSSGTVPNSSSNVIINPGASVILNTPVTVHGISVSPGATVNVAAGGVLTLYGQ